MQIIIPMSGFGERFRRAGYDLPKPLIVVDGKPIIEHVVDLFPGEREFIFVCNSAHLAEPSFAMEATLRRIAPHGRVVAIEPHKLGPVHAVLAAREAIDPVRPCFVNYADFACYWDWTDFKTFVAETACDGALPCYRGFHPHSLHSAYYAYVREQGLWAEDIQEKTPFTSTPMQEFASSGGYYFRTGELMLESFEAAVRQKLTVKDEYYVSMAYKPLLAAGGQVAVYELQHFMQWGTPEDLNEYQHWSALFAEIARGAHAAPALPGVTIMLASGAGARFAIENYQLPKPLIPVSGVPMLLQAMRDLPQAPAQRLVLRADMRGSDEIAAALRADFPAAETVLLKELTDGQARSAYLAAEGLADDVTVTIGACDNGLLYDPLRFQALTQDQSADVIVWGARRHPPALRIPERFSWIDADAKGRVLGVSVKQPLSNPAEDPIVVGAFTFRRAGDLRRAAEALFARRGAVNGEYYLDACVNDAVALGLSCRLMEVDHYLGWGTPDELRTYEYWQSCFHKWASHPYRLEKDADVSPLGLVTLEQRARDFAPARPAAPARRN